MDGGATDTKEHHSPRGNRPPATGYRANLAACVARREDARQLADRTFATLTPLCRTADVMVRDDEASDHAVARALGITRAAVCGHVVAAQRRLRIALLELRVA
jgi:DNA-directed RNA polymerase specialized sigma24 family protein